MTIGFKSLLGRAGDDNVVERRAEWRRRVLLKADVHPVVDYAAAAVENVSRTGLMVECATPLKIDQTIAISVEDEAFYMATVRWAREHRYGLRLQDALLIFGFEDDAIDDAASEQVRERRHEVTATARIAILGKSQPGIIRDVSQSGLQVEGDFTFPEAQDVIVEPKGRPLILGEVRWSDGSKAGVRTAHKMAVLRMVYSYE